MGVEKLSFVILPFFVFLKSVFFDMSNLDIIGVQLKDVLRL